MKKSRRARGVFGAAAFVLFAILCWTAAYYITSTLYTSLGKQPEHELIRQLINSLLGFFIVFVIMFSIAICTAPKRMDNFKSIIDAMKRIASGDFKVNLNRHPHNPFGDIVDGINHMALELNQMEQMRQEFISNVSHEIQSPLTSISGFAKVLQKDLLSREEQIYYLGIIESESMRLSKLSDNLLKLTSLESEHHPFVPKPYRLDIQLRNIVLSCEPQWLEKELEMDISLTETIIEADEDLMSQVWINLIINSIKFTPNGGIIGIHLHKQGHEAFVCISDTGPGIAEEDQTQVFERFYKTDKSRHRNRSGSGLGLAIAKKIVEMHQGTIQLESKPGEGTVMTVRI
jgi:two-component system phosphate regulon sensor histidine kinase PhoR